MPRRRSRRTRELLEGSLTPTARSVIPAVASSAPSGGAVSAAVASQRERRRGVRSRRLIAPSAALPQPSPRQRSGGAVSAASLTGPSGGAVSAPSPLGTGGASRLDGMR